MILTHEFDIKPFVYSDTARRLNIVNKPTPEAEANLRSLFENLLLPLMQSLPGEFNVTSGYRCDKLNAAVKGKPTSQHTKGMAADIEYFEHGTENNHILINKVKESGIEFDQCINEYGRWVHLSYNATHNRKQFLTIK